VAGIGDTLSLPSGEQLACHLDVTGVPGTLAQLIGRTGVIAAAIADGAGHVTLDATVDPAQGFVRAEVRRPSGAVGDPTVYQSAAPMVALTNPIFTWFSG
jgi:hypothetical protein